jgi:alpha-soluble NSF attachment protein
MSTSKADEHVEQAEKKLKGWGMFGNKWEDALDLYNKAINLYKINKAWDKAADVLQRTVQCHYKLDSKYDAASAWMEAGQMWRKVPKMEDAVRCFDEASKIYLDLGKFASAAKVEKEMGDMLEEAEDFANAITHLQLAADYFDSENQKTTANSCLLRVAHMNATLGNYDAAVEQFEKSIEMAVDDKMLKFQAKEYIFKACICRLAAITEDAETKLEEFNDKHQEYKDQDVHYPDSFEAKLIDGVVAAWKNGDLKSFQASMREYDRIKKLDNWKTAMFLKIKQNVEKAGEVDLR